MKKILAIVALLLLTLFSFGQSGDIKIKRGFGTKFESDGRTLKPREVLEIMEPVPDAHAAFKKAKSNYDAASVVGFIGGFMVGWPLGTALGGGDPEWGLAAGGAVLILASLPMSSAFNKHSKTAVDLFNGKNTVDRKLKPSLHVNVYGTGAKLALRF